MDIRKIIGLVEAYSSRTIEKFWINPKDGLIVTVDGEHMEEEGFDLVPENAVGNGRVKGGLSNYDDSYYLTASSFVLLRDAVKVIRRRYGDATSVHYDIFSNDGSEESGVIAWRDLNQFFSGKV